MACHEVFDKRYVHPYVALQMSRCREYYDSIKLVEIEIHPNLLRYRKLCVHESKQES